MKKAEIIAAANDYGSLLNKTQLRPEEQDRLEMLHTRYGHMHQFKRIANDNYDQRAMHPGFGAPNCSCHISPPCQACVDFTNADPTMAYV